MTDARPEGWLDVKERGAVLGIRFVAWLCTAFGRGAARAFVAVLAGWYALLDRRARSASREWFTRLDGEPSFARTYAQIRAFAQTAVDRFFFLKGRRELFVTESHGTEHLRELSEAGKGAILVGAHLGSFEAMRAVGKGRSYRIHIVGDFRNARMVNAVLKELDPESQTRVIEVDPDGVDFMLRIRDLIERGDFVAILGDRVGPGTRSVEVDFMGGRARLPVGPYVLASTLRCPVLLTFALYSAPNRYDVYCEPFDAPRLDRKDREGSLRALAQRYAQRLEHYARLAPDNWFNFYDFWSAP